MAQNKKLTSVNWEAAWWNDKFQWAALADKGWDGWMMKGELLDGIEELGIKRTLYQVAAGMNANAGGSLNRRATLQDYWRIDFETGKWRHDPELQALGLLVAAPDGVLWHLAHVPLRWRDGTPAKEAWPTSTEKLLETEIALRLKRTATSDVDSIGVLRGKDRRAQFRGVIFLSPLSRSKENQTLNVTCNLASLPSWDASGVEFGPGADFISALFRNPLKCRNATFEGANFSSAVFLNECDFEKAQFSAAAFFDGATFCSSSQFDGCVFEKQSSFKQCSFIGDSKFRRLKAEGHCLFSGATYTRFADFQGAEFGGTLSFSRVVAKRGRFSSATFGGPVNFDAAEIDELDLSGAIFHHPVVFQDGKFAHSINLRTVQFKSSLNFDNVTVKDILGFDQLLLDLGLRIYEFEPFRMLLESRRSRLLGVAKPDAQLDSEMRALERFFRTAKLAMENLRARTEEQEYYRLELIARRKRSDIGIIEKTASILFEVTCDYGASLRLPLIWLAGTVIAFTIFYAISDVGLSFGLNSYVDWQALGKAFEFSFSRIIPFGAFEDVSKEWLNGYAASRGSLSVIGLRLMATLESLFAIILIFCFTLAIRRKFQIN